MYTPEIEPAAAKLKDEGDVEWTSRDYYFETKEDGFRCLLHLPPGERMFATGRNRLDKGEGPYAEWALNVPHLEPSDRSEAGLTIIDGEILPPQGIARRMLAGVCNVKDPAKAAAWCAANGKPFYNAFDILFHNGKDVRSEPAHLRRKLLKFALHAFWKGHRYVGTTDHADPAKVDAKQFYLDLIARGGEGVMCKAAGAPYGEGWWKVKRKHDIDVFITGFKAAKEGKTGKFKGMVGALAVSVLDDRHERPGPWGAPVEVAHVSGFDDETRQLITDNPSAYMSRVLTVRAQELDGKGRLMSPRFKEWRPDLDAKSCTHSKMMRDLEASRGSGE